MSYHESSIGASDEWYTPVSILNAIDESYDLDPCWSDSPYCFVPAKKTYTTNGLGQPWAGFVFVNPPFGGRNGQVPWLIKFLDHANGIAIVRAYTSSEWFHSHAIKSDCLLFPAGKTKFVRPDGSVGKSPGHGIVLLGMGERAFSALKKSGIGFFIDNRHD